MYKLGNLYLTGDGVSKEIKRAYKWIEKAAVAGHADAMCVMGRFYPFGCEEAPQDLEKSREWFEKAAAAGSEQGRKDLASDFFRV